MRRIFSIILGLVNTGAFLALFCLCVVSMFGLIFCLPLGLLYLTTGIGLMKQSGNVRKIYFIGVIPLSLLAAWNITLLGGPQMVGSTYYTPSAVQFKMIFFCMILPFLVNLIFLNLLKISQTSDQHSLNI